VVKNRDEAGGGNPLNPQGNFFGFRSSLGLRFGTVFWALRICTALPASTHERPERMYYMLTQPTEEKIGEVKGFYASVDHSHEFFQRRLKNLLSGTDKESIDKERFWQELFIAICTSQSKSGLKSGIARMEKMPRFPGRLERLDGAENVEELLREVLPHYKVRFPNDKAAYLAHNHNLLSRNDEELWSEISDALELLRFQQSRKTEMRTARLLRGFKGVGHKQSRNVLQGLGLTKDEIPIDSKVVKWLEEFGFLTFQTKYQEKRFLQSLSSKKQYRRLMDDLQTLCKQCELHPCLLDAAIYLYYHCEGCRG
jgi:thermostable 8-oxoguanine DNA glycosylase